MTAKGSEQFTWAQVGGKQPCAGCGTSLRVEDVVVQTGYPRVAVYCRDCFNLGVWARQQPRVPSD